MLVRQALARRRGLQGHPRVAVQGQAVTANSSPITDPSRSTTNPSLKEYSFDPRDVQGAPRGGRRGRTLKLDDDLLPAGPRDLGVGPHGQGRRGQGRHHHRPQGDGPRGTPTWPRPWRATTTSTPVPSPIMDDPVSNMSLQYLPDGAINYSQVNDPKLNKLIQQAQAAVDPPSQQKTTGAAGRRPRARQRDRQRHVRPEPPGRLHAGNWTGFVVKPSELLVHRRPGYRWPGPATVDQAREKAGSPHALVCPRPESATAWSPLVRGHGNVPVAPSAARGPGNRGRQHRHGRPGCARRTARAVRTGPVPAGAVREVPGPARAG